MNPRVLLTRRLPAIAAETIRTGGFDVDAIDQDIPPARGELLDRIRGCAGVIPILADRIDAGFLDAAGSSLTIVANCAVGFDNIDLDECRKRGVRASNTPGVLTDATAELTWALILAAARRVVEGDRLVRSGAWTGWAPLQMLGVELAGSTLGIVGAGRIGTAVGLRAAAFKMRLLYADTSRNTQLESESRAERVDLERIVSESDVISLHVPLTPQTRHLMRAEHFQRMKPTAILINTARGLVVDEAALLDALRRHAIAGAGLDVYEHEPQLTPGLAGLDNVVLLPHIGSATTRTRERMAAMAAENVVAVLSGREPPNAVV